MSKSSILYDKVRKEGKKGFVSVNDGRVVFS